ncbi:hypothetical protein [Candidatus Nitrotoga arctica]|uniref:hypothetical protein n=1 Tax=Candidatus Nitrotoga arctica TaxID=453162 RepID=UPI001EFAD449|nr:hypothetical protein [Candidatus Nitrotoga arctica]
MNSTYSLPPRQQVFPEHWRYCLGHVRFTFIDARRHCCSPYPSDAPQRGDQPISAQCFLDMIGVTAQVWGMIIAGEGKP